MKLSEQMKYSHLPLGTPPGLREMIKGWVDDVAQLEAKLESSMCLECEKSMLHCTCDEESE